MGMRPIRSQLVWGREHYELVVQQVRKATVSVWIATANLTDLHVEVGGRRYGSMLGELDDLCRRGVALRILHASLPSRPFRDTFDRYPRLVEGGLELRQCPGVHLKTVIVDGRWLYLGSANWTGAGIGAKSDAKRNFELGWLTGDEDVLDEVQAHYERIWSGGDCLTCGQRDVCEAPLHLDARSRAG
jgi:phosphatidylserine/phosphatidylglycerophosphate/cardiolipin synthase-like enzyme